MMCTNIVLNVKTKTKNNFCTQHALNLYFSMNNLSSYCGLTDSRIRASDRDLPVFRKGWCVCHFPKQTNQINFLVKNFDLWSSIWISHYPFCQKLNVWKIYFDFVTVWECKLKNTLIPCPYIAQLCKRIWQLLSRTIYKIIFRTMTGFGPIFKVIYFAILMIHSDLIWN